VLTIVIPDVDLYDDESSMFFKSQGATLLLEHSLVSLSKWEAIWTKPFLDGISRTTEETRSYVACMNLAPVYSEDIYKRLSDDNVREVAAYIDSKQTASWFKDDLAVRTGNSDIITNEVIYYWMISHTIPMETQYWHLNRLLTLIKVCNEKNKPASKSKMGTREQAMSRDALNKKRKAELNTTG